MRATGGAGDLLDRLDARLERAGQLLAASDRGVLARGFALVRGSEGQPLRNAAAISPGQHLDIEFTDGRVGALAEAPARSNSRRADPAAPA